MNKFNLLLLAGAAALTGCASEDVINSGDITPPTGSQAMTFSMLTGNMSRANLDAAGHKDFGVFAYKGTDMVAGLVMKNYQVKHEATEKYGSLWQYDQIPNQVLKYWDYSFANHYFVAYTPYASTGVTLTANNSATAELKSDLAITGAESFYLMSARDNNEAMWCTQTVAKANYGEEVPLTFNHLNAVIKLAFRSNIPGYTVKIKNLTSDAAGVQLTPATAAQATATINWTWGGTENAQPTISQEYVTKANFTIADVFNNSAVPTTTVQTKATANLVFPLADTDNTPAITELEIPSVPGGSTDYKPLASQFFALPLTNADAYKDEGENHFATGYTLHVTYELIPNDGAATTTVHDARVFIPADKCKWAYGKLYLYRFTITTASSGVTDPNTQIYDNSTGSNYVDPTDPRVPTDKALLPIVFDGVQVEGYENVVTYYNIN